MKTLLRITPLQKKSIDTYFEVYALEENKPARYWNVVDQYRTGHAFVELSDVQSAFANPESVRCCTDVGPGPELVECHNNYFEFSESMSSQEKDLIERLWTEGNDEGVGGVAWLDSVCREWEIVDEYLQIYLPVKIDLVDGKTFAVVQENLSNQDLMNLLPKEGA